MHSKNFYNKILVFFLFTSLVSIFYKMSRDNESQHRCSFRQRLVHLAKVLRFFLSFFIFVSFKINVVFRSRTSRARYISFTIGEANEDMSRPSSLCVFSISPRRRLLRNNNAFPWFIWHRRRNNSPTNFTRTEWRPRIILRSSSTVTMYDLHRSDIYIYIYFYVCVCMCVWRG